MPAVESVKVGNPADDPELDMGPLVSRGSRSEWQGSWSGRAATAPRSRPVARRSGDRGFFYRPTVVTDVAQDAEIIQSEVFGPVVTVQHFADDEEGIAWANGVNYGLAASVWTRDVKRALNAAAACATGPSGSTTT